MNGLRFDPQTPIYEDKSALVPRVVNRSDFDTIFRVLYSELGSYRWIISDTPILDFPEEWFVDAWYDEEQDVDRSPELDEYYSSIIDTVGSSFLAEPGYVTRYLQYLHDDWLDIYAVPPSFSDLKGFLKSYWDFKEEKERNLWLAETVELCFFNIDGMFWEFYSNHEKHLNVLEEHVKKIPAFQAIGRSFEEML
ncbi:MAG: hypothetical protein SD837_02960 [Candidatus Electrothrix scaldis]|nr:MAG: hypothetical protein SD837_02960 [Candidatus Electrothrix sp. GW3-3]